MRKISSCFIFQFHLLLKSSRTSPESVPSDEAAVVPALFLMPGRGTEPTTIAEGRVKILSKSGSKGSDEIAPSSHPCTHGFVLYAIHTYHTYHNIVPHSHCGSRRLVGEPLWLCYLGEAGS